MVSSNFFAVNVSIVLVGWIFYLILLDSAYSVVDGLFILVLRRFVIVICLNLVY